MDSGDSCVIRLKVTEQKGKYNNNNKVNNNNNDNNKFNNNN
jgi:hypothetical protein